MDLELAIDKARGEALKSFELSLALNSIGLGDKMLSRALEAPASDKNMSVTKMAAAQTGLTVSNAREQMESTELENLKMMRVASSEAAKTMSPGERFQMLYGMYGEWKEQNAGSPSTAAARNQDDLVKLRGAIYHLKQKPELSAADKVLLAELQARLKAAQHRA